MKLESLVKKMEEKEKPEFISLASEQRTYRVFVFIFRLKIYICACVDEKAIKQTQVRTRNKENFN